MRGLVALGAVLAACGSSGSTVGAPDTTTGADGGGGDGGPLCDHGIVFVSTKGDDANSGCDPERPKRTLTASLGEAQAKQATSTEIHVCAELLEEHVVLGYPVSIVGGFDCNTWAAGAGRTTLEAGSDSIETLIVFGTAVDAKVRLEHLRVVGPSRTSGAVSAMRFTGGSAPIVHDVEVQGGSTNEGISVAVGIEGSSPTIEDGTIAGGRARCTMGCAGTTSSGIAIAGTGATRLRRLRIDGGEAEVVPAGSYVGAIALDVFGTTKATGDDAFSDLEIVHGKGIVAGALPSWGVRVLDGAEIDLASSKVLAANATSTCATSPCGAVAVAVGNATLRIRKSRITTTGIAGAPGTTGIVTRQSGVYATKNGRLAVVSSFVNAGTTTVDSAPTAIIDVKGSTLVAPELVLNNAADISVTSSLLGLARADSVPFLLFSCAGATKTTLASSVVVGAGPSFSAVFGANGAQCENTSATPTLAATVAASNGTNAFSAPLSLRIAADCTGEDVGACVVGSLLDVLADVDPIAGLKLKDGVPCKVSQGGAVLADVPDDAFGMPRTPPPSMGAHEYDGACAN